MTTLPDNAASSSVAGIIKTENESKGSSSTSNVKASNSRVGAQRRPPPPQKKIPQKKAVAAVNNIRQENIAQLIQKKRECEKKAHEIVLRLIEPQVDKEYLLDNAIRISQPHMEDVIEERKLGQLCGWVLCDNKIDPNHIPKQTYKIRGHKVFDITDRKNFCCGKCYSKSVHFKNQLLTSPLWLRDIDDDAQFEILDDHETKELQWLSVALTSVSLSDDEDEKEDDKDDEENFEKLRQNLYL